MALLRGGIAENVKNTRVISLGRDAFHERLGLPSGHDGGTGHQLHGIRRVRFYSLAILHSGLGSIGGILAQYNLWFRVQHLIEEDRRR
jgi:hypothetical protein